jgi:hypothetical protein
MVEPSSVRVSGAVAVETRSPLKVEAIGPIKVEADHPLRVESIPLYAWTPSRSVISSRRHFQLAREIRTVSF